MREEARHRTPAVMPEACSMGPLLTLKEHELLRAAQRAGVPNVECSLDLG
ncbi:MAG: hypothetical protein HY272_09205 [Gammaproteobacteria bacterium]|nr:hypothetical protein [Gammaproteobacteria bacterium]